MMHLLRIFTLAWLAATATASTPALIGEAEKVYTLAPANTAIGGVAFDDVSADAPRLLVLDQSGKVFVYGLDLDPAKGKDELRYLECVDLPAKSDGSALSGPRGLAFARHGARPVLYFLNWSASGGGVTSELWQWRIDDNSISVTDLSLFSFGIGEREVIDLTCHEDKIRICFDASGYRDRNLRVQRGIIELDAKRARGGKVKFVKHLPDCGEARSLGLADMELDGAPYIWATRGNESIYAAEGTTGRGLFFFDRPRSTETKSSSLGLCFGHGFLWVPENVGGPGRIQRVNVTRNLDAAREAPRIFRRLIMTIDTEPEADAAVDADLAVDDAGAVRHYYSRPYAYEQLGNQGVWPETESVVDLSKARNATITERSYDPADDTSSRQWMRLVEYSGAPARAYSSKYGIDLWTNQRRMYVYPHRANHNADELRGTDYLADDADLFNLSDTKTYNRFFERVRAHMEAKYGAAADMDNPYWAARNALEYIQDNYYYPSRPKGIPAAVDYDRSHYDANPGNLKIELSEEPYDKSQIIACSGTSVMMAGAMRHLKIPARWLGTGTEKGPAAWDTNGNGLLDRDETAPCTNGHRYSQVWLGDHYGWACFDATPSVPDHKDYDPPPPFRSQWRYMSRAAAGHMRDRRIVFNVGSGLFRPLYRDFEYDRDLAVNNDCGGDQRYNLQGRFEKPELWKLARQRIYLKNQCFITGVRLSGPKKKTKVVWKLEGDWHKAPDARLCIFLQRVDRDSHKARNLGRLAKALPCKAGQVTVDLSAYRGEGFRIMLRREGDPETGGQSALFDLE